MAENIKTIKFHTPVQIGPHPLTYLNPGDFNARKAGIEQSNVTRTAHGIEIKTGNQVTIVGWANIVYLTYDVVGAVEPVKQASEVVEPVKPIKKS